MSSLPNAETLILGGGLAGTTVALELARNGRAPILIERTRAPQHKVCGEFLSGEAIHYLTRYGIDLTACGAVPLRIVRLVTSSSITEETLPFAACSLTRRLLDELLLARAALFGADIRRGCHAERLARDGNAWSLELRDAEPIRCTNLFLATGKHDLRGWPRPAGTQRGLVAFKMYYRLTVQQHAALGDAVELILFPGGYAGLQPVEDNRVNLCLLVTAARLKSIGSNWNRLLAYLLQQVPHLATRLSGAEPLLDAPLTASHIPYGHLQQATAPGLWRVGDQAAVIPSFLGDGMSIAMHSGAMAAHHLLAGSSSQSYQKDLRSQLRSRIALATRLSQLLVAFPAAAHLSRVIPGLLSRIATLTRIPETALL